MKKLLCQKSFLCFAISVSAIVFHTSFAFAGVLVRDSSIRSDVNYLDAKKSTNAQRLTQPEMRKLQPALLEKNPFEKRIINFQKAEYKYYLAYQKWEAKVHKISLRNQEEQRIMKAKYEGRKTSSKVASKSSGGVRSGFFATLFGGKKSEAKQETLEKPQQLAVQKTVATPKVPTEVSDPRQDSAVNERALFARYRLKDTGEKPSVQPEPKDPESSLWVHFKKALTGF